MQTYLNKVAVVTGAGSGIGRALAIQLAQAGARLALSDVNEAGLARTLELLPENTNAKTYRVDVSNKEQVFAHADDVRRDFGTAHYVFNNAGVTLIGTVANVTMEEIEWQININLWGVIYGTKAFLPMLLAQNEGHIVNMSSVLGLVSVPCQAIYSVTKFGVRGLTEGLARELEGTGVRATSVHPGGIRTEIGHAARFCKAAGAAEQLVSDKLDTLLLTPPEDCARKILADVARGKRRIRVGSSARTIDWLARLLPASYGKVLKPLRGL